MSKFDDSMFDDISGKKMASARESNKDGSCSEYEQLKQENIERNKRRLASLNIPEIVKSMEHQGPSKKISKVGIS